MTTHNIRRTLLTCAIIPLLTACGHRQATLQLDGGVYTGELKDGLPDGYGEWEDTIYGKRYSGFWRNGDRDGTGIYTCGDTCYKGTFSRGKYDGSGLLYVGDSLAYSGQWTDGKRDGKGLTTNIDGNTVSGTWSLDTLRQGTFEDGYGTYTGELDSLGAPHGIGSYTWLSGECYEGEWASGKPHGSGFSARAGAMLRCGSWVKGVFRGERMTHTSDRIYGIDISRYQHEIGKKKYGIDWGQLRIVGLGPNKSRKVDGSVDYPVSFVYIKSTQGVKIQSKYYASDARSARAHGIKCGAYHFFSTNRGGHEQALNFLKNTVIKSGDLPPVLDIEPTDAQIRAMGGRDVLFREMRQWLDLVERNVGVRPILYVSQSFIKNHLSHSSYLCDNYDVWIARYGAYKPDVKLQFWQLSPDGKVRGIKGDVDINVYNGYESSFKAFCQESTVP